MMTSSHTFTDSQVFSHVAAAGVRESLAAASHASAANPLLPTGGQPPSGNTLNVDLAIPSQSLFSAEIIPRIITHVVICVNERVQLVASQRRRGGGGGAGGQQQRLAVKCILGTHGASFLLLSIEAIVKNTKLGIDEILNKDRCFAALELAIRAEGREAEFGKLSSWANINRRRTQRSSKSTDRYVRIEFKCSRCRGILFNADLDASEGEVTFLEVSECMGVHRRIRSELTLVLSVIR